MVFLYLTDVSLIDAAGAESLEGICAWNSKGRSHICIRLAINQPEQKLVGVLAATVETVLLQQRSVSLSSPNAKANRCDLSSFRPSRQLQAVKCKCS